MARLVVKPKKKSKLTKFERFSLKFILIAVALSFFTDTFLKSYAVSLSAEQQRLTAQIREQRQENETLQVQIKELSSYNRIMEIAKLYGLELHPGNIVTVERR